jgi:uncharacterized membrane protein (UPF0127 family)
MKLRLEGREYLVYKCGFLEKIRGLMFSKKRNLLFDLNDKRELIHSLWVFFPIKLYFLDENFEIIEKGVLRPFWFYIPRVKAKWLVEIPV